jgi:hypothetical protein
MDCPPDLTPPHEFLAALARQVAVSGLHEESVYLNAANPRDRWRKEAFRSVDDEFRYKLLWVAKRLREHLGSPSHSAYEVVAALKPRCYAAAAWHVDGTIGYLGFRTLQGRRRPRLRVVIGVIKPGTSSQGSARATSVRRRTTG